MKTKKIYELSPYLKELTGEIIEIEKTAAGIKVLLDQTIFYPEGGGQPSDGGFIIYQDQKVPVQDIQIEEDEIWHLLKEENFSVGEKVDMEIDWDLRFKNMQMHTAEHIFSGLVKNKYDGENVGFHISKDGFTCDYNIEIPADRSRELELESNKIIQENRKLMSYYPSPEDILKIDYRSKKEIQGEIRITEIPEIDYCACCGTHVNSTGEVGYLKVVSREKYKGGTRFTIKAGMEAVVYSLEKVEIAQKIANDYSCSIEDLPNRIEKGNLELEELRVELKSCKEEGIERLSSTIKEGPPLYMKENISMEEGRGLANILLPKVQTLFLHLEKDQFIIASSENKSKAIFEKLSESLKGGGSPQMIQGKIIANKENLEKKFYEIIEDLMKG